MPAGKKTTIQMYALCPQATLKARPGTLQKPTMSNHPSGTPSNNETSALTKVATLKGKWWAHDG
jgi:hypothetical protein